MARTYTEIPNGLSPYALSLGGLRNVSKIMIMIYDVEEAYFLNIFRIEGFITLPISTMRTMTIYS